MGATKVIRLSDGRELQVDVATLTQKEYRGFFSASVSDEASDKVLARLCNEKTKYIAELLRDDYRRVLDTVIELANRPLDDPNSPSESTLP